jgi:hypothetical protein
MNHYNIELGISFNRNNLRGSLQSLLYNITANQFVVALEPNAFGVSSVADILNQSHKILESGINLEWFLKREKFLMKLTVQERLEGITLLSPIKPFKLKKSFGAEHEVIDLAFYIQCSIELCENFAVGDFRVG